MIFWLIFCRFFLAKLCHKMWNSEICLLPCISACRFIWKWTVCEIILKKLLWTIFKSRLNLNVYSILNVSLRLLRAVDNGPENWVVCQYFHKFKELSQKSANLNQQLLSNCRFNPLVLIVPLMIATDYFWVHVIAITITVTVCWGSVRPNVWVLQNYFFKVLQNNALCKDKLHIP